MVFNGLQVFSMVSIVFDEWFSMVCDGFQLFPIVVNGVRWFSMDSNGFQWLSTIGPTIEWLGIGMAMRMQIGCLSEICAAYIALYPTYVG